MQVCPQSNDTADPDPGACEFGDDVVVSDPVMLGVLHSAKLLARFPSSVLITGETGSGKEVVARVLHRFCGRSGRPWVDVNCAALPEHLVESELFGHERGAFSGADSSKPGLFEVAHEGTLFLDEIGELDSRVQAKLLRVLDSSTFYRLGGTRKITVDVRIIAATNRDLEAAVAAEAFRRDLYHRIAESHIHIPPLRERPDDIPSLAAYFLKQQAPQRSFTEDALELLSSMQWLGNARELRNAVTKLGIGVSHSTISAGDVRQLLTNARLQTSSSSASRGEGVLTINEMERRMILSALESTGGNQSRAAERLGIPRRTFCRKLDEYQITLGRRRRVRGNSSDLTEASRFELKASVELSSPTVGSCVVQATNVSAGGIGLAAIPASFTPGDEVQVRLTLPDQRAVMEATASIVWRRTDGTAGARFLHMSEKNQKSLMRWLASADQSGAVSSDRNLEHQIPA